jgi:hypothetical protein
MPVNPNMGYTPTSTKGSTMQSNTQAKQPPAPPAQPASPAAGPVDRVPPPETHASDHATHYGDGKAKMPPGVTSKQC